MSKTSPQTTDSNKQTMIFKNLPAQPEIQLTQFDRIEGAKRTDRVTVKYRIIKPLEKLHRPALPLPKFASLFLEPTVSTLLTEKMPMFVLVDERKSSATYVFVTKIIGARTSRIFCLFRFVC